MPDRAIVALLRRQVPGCVALFPSEAVEGIALPISELTAQARAFPALYTAILDAVSPVMADRLGIPLEAASVFSRKAVVPLANFVLDRAIRLDRLLKKRRDADLFVAQGPSPRPPDTITEFMTLAGSSASFNQSLLCLLAPAWGLECRPFPHDEAPFAPPRSDARFQNFNLTGSSALDKVQKRLQRLAGGALAGLRAAWRGRIPAFAMEYHSDALEAAGLFGRNGLVRLDLSGLPGPVAAPDASLRRRVFEETLPSYSASVKGFLKDAGVDDRPAAAVPAMLAGFLAFMAPARLLETVPEGLRRAQVLLRPYADRPLVLSQFDERRGIFAVAAARGMGMDVIGCQHGGGYGQFDLDQMCSRSIEFPAFDRFITWGWNRFPEGIAERGIEAVPLPVPWLSHGARVWRREFRGSGGYGTARDYDVLFLCDRVSPCGQPAMGLEVIRTDLLREHASLLKGLVAEASRRGISILHKPYTQETVTLLEGTFEEMERVGGSHYTRLRHLNKGLDPDLMRKCRMLLLMRPSTSFQQCLAAEVPVMVLWPRHIIGESPSSRRVFSELESCGILHHDPAGFCEAYLRFRAAPDDWMREPRRVKAVRRFLRQYGWTRPDWKEHWARFLASLSKPAPSSPPRRA
ncbi:MAG: hypothetical protein HY924_17325 [Elusimicrobia bacterium]|nr:hypothetical protein [Elusimicrobiota bacterium]